VNRVAFGVKFDVAPQLRIAHPVQVCQSRITAVVVQPQLSVNQGCVWETNNIVRLRYRGWVYSRAIRRFQGLWP
ncbi:TPA: hypothetical protein RXQ35_004672, partial [Escherichia coli]|nr:hypothetical protein [Escherichia coli]